MQRTDYSGESKIAWSDSLSRLSFVVRHGVRHSGSAYWFRGVRCIVNAGEWHAIEFIILNWI